VTAATPYVPLPTGIGFCTACAANVRIDDLGRCSCGELCIWPEGRPRPAIETETLLKVLEAGRVDPSSRQGVHRQPLNRRQRRKGASPCGPRGESPPDDITATRGEPCAAPDRRLGIAPGAAVSPSPDEPAAGRAAVLAARTRPGPRALPSIPTQHESRQRL
jgi:hypothetical protein